MKQKLLDLKTVLESPVEAAKLGSAISILDEVFQILESQGSPSPCRMLRLGKGFFGEALIALKAGKKVARSGWNGKGMYLWLLPKATIQKSWVKDPLLLSVFPEGSEELDCLGSIRMLTATGEVLTGWLASQTDMLADDWCIVE